MILTLGYAMLMSPNKDETAVHGCHCPGDVAVRMRKVLAIPHVYVLGSPLHPNMGQVPPVPPYLGPECRVCQETQFKETLNF